MGRVVEGTSLVERVGDDWVAYRQELGDALGGMCRGGGVDVVAVEGLRVPSPHLRVVNLEGALDTSRVLGWVECLAPLPVVVVAPGGHGASALGAYPGELVGPRERAGGGRLRHVRSAFDVAQAAVFEARVRGVL